MGEWIPAASIEVSVQIIAFWKEATLPVFIVLGKGTEGMCTFNCFLSISFQTSVSDEIDPLRTCRRLVFSISVE